MCGPNVSVLIPAYNAEATVEAAVASMLRQTLDDIEIVAVDDGSTDSTPLMLDSIATRDPRVRVIHTERHGIIGALNTGIAECRGELIARMDADDISHPRRLEMQVALMDEHPEVSVCGTLVRMFPRWQLLGGLVRYEQWLNSLVTHDEIARDVFVESPLAHPSVMMRREELIEIGGYQDHGWAEDYDLWLRYHIAGKRFAKVPITLTFWRQSEGRLTFTDPRYSVENFLRAKAHYLAQIVPPPLRRGLGGGPSSARTPPQPSPQRGGSSRTPPQPSPPRGGSSRTPPQPSPERGGSSRTPPQPSPPRGGSSQTPPQPSPQRGGSSRTPPQPSPQRGGGSRTPPQPSPPRGGSGRVIILWGAGKTGRRLSKHLLREGVDFQAVIDIDPAKIGRTLRGKPIVGVEYPVGRDDPLRHRRRKLPRRARTHSGAAL